ncbi:hypothetical protein Tco_1184262 [Tanacetum coccineum]
MMMVVPVEEVYVEALQVKYPIIDWEVYSEDTRRYWKIIRVGNHTEAYQIFAEMLKKFDRDDLIKLLYLVKKRFSTTEPIDDKEKELWVKLVHHVSSVRGHDIFMLVEKDYPLSKGVLILMLVNKLSVVFSVSSPNEPKSRSALLVTPLPDSKEIPLREVEIFDLVFSLTQSVGVTRVMETPSFGFHHMPSPRPAAYSPTEAAQYESWGVSDDDDDDDDDDQQGDDERTKSGDDKNDVDDEEYDCINKEMYDDVNVELKDVEPADEGNGDEEMTDAEKCMHTRSSSNLISESSTTPKRRNRRCSKQRVKPFSLEETSVVTMADQRTMAELFQAPTEGYGDAIVIPVILAENFKLKHAAITISIASTTTSSGTGPLPSNTIANPRGDLKAITTRSGVSYDGPPIPPPSSSLPKVVEWVPEVTKDTVQPSTKNIQPSVVQTQVLIDEPVLVKLRELKHDAESMNRIDVIDVACREYAQEVLGFLEISTSGNPTSEPIISTFTPTLTPFGDSDFLLEETDAFLAIEDDSISSEIDDSYYDS